MITNNISNNVASLIKTKVLKASKTNGLKQQIISILHKESKKRDLTKYEMLNLLNAIPRNGFFVQDNGVTKVEYKYKWFRVVEDNPDSVTYTMVTRPNSWVFVI